MKTKWEEVRISKNLMLNIFIIFKNQKIIKAKTGFPWIDACMRQLIQEGWIHHVCRNSLAIFLTRGDLFISWEHGMNTFFKYLIDVKLFSSIVDYYYYFFLKTKLSVNQADWSVNAGNWNWVSCGEPEEILQKESRFCPVEHSKKLDPNGEYIKKYIPELKEFPLVCIYI